jgi:hypothetical protein
MGRKQGTAMTNEERAEVLLLSTRFIRSGPAVDLILAYADEIRRECADRSVAYCKKYEGFLDGEDDQYLSAAIMGKEAGE